MKPDGENEERAAFGRNRAHNRDNGIRGCEVVESAFPLARLTFEQNNQPQNRR